MLSKRVAIVVIADQTSPVLVKTAEKHRQALLLRLNRQASEPDPGAVHLIADVYSHEQCC